MKAYKTRTLRQLMTDMQQAELSPLKQCLQQADQLYRWNQQMQRALPRALAASVRLCNIRKNGVAVIAVPSQGVASQVYLHQQTILNTLQKLQLPVTQVSLRILPPKTDDPTDYRALPGLWHEQEKPSQ